MTWKIFITINIQVNQKIFTQTVYSPLYFMLQSGKSLQVPFGPNSTSNSSRLLAASDQSYTVEVTLTKFMLTYISGALSNSSVARVPSTQPGTDYDAVSGLITISLPLSTPQSTRYLVTAVAEDSDGKVFKITQDMAIISYQQGSDTASLDDLKSIMLESLDVTAKVDVPNVASANLSVSQAAGIFVSNFTDADFRMVIESVDQMGAVVIKFSRSLIAYYNVSLLDSDVLSVKVKSPLVKSDQDHRNLAFTWRALNIIDVTMKLQLNFSSPLAISTLQVSSISDLL